MKKQAGIWLDARNAWIVNLSTDGADAAELQHVASGAHSGASGGHTTWGPHRGDHQRNAQERQHHEERAFFEKIISQLDPATTEVVVFGPSEAKHGLYKLLAERPDGPEIAGVEAADRQSERQMVAWVRDYFHHDAARKLPKFGRETPAGHEKQD